ncbi:MAG TPA: formylglycine-generating enzyme family protein, partial [Thermotogota bacterium]|nr:formylglycine-generating enzyme family protein [Thermotogota bacterium]
ANEETYWIPGFREGEVQLTYNHMQWLLGQIVREKGGVDQKLFEERVEWLKTVLWCTSEMVRVRGGTFRMGNTRNDPEGNIEEKPHEVTLTYDFWMGKYPVVFAEYDQYCRIMKEKPPSDEGWGRGSRPVMNVSWFDAIGYCNWLSEKEGLAKAYDGNGNLLDGNGRTTRDITKVEGYRLPTEAEWEYAARGGHKSEGDYKYAGSNDLDRVGWYGNNSGNKTHPVGQKDPNELGLYDMSGNVLEWCHDGYDKNWYKQGSQTNPVGPSQACSYRVRRGGGWDDKAHFCRVANRLYHGPSNSYYHPGLRLSRTY